MNQALLTCHKWALLLVLLFLNSIGASSQDIFNNLQITEYKSVSFGPGQKYSAVAQRFRTSDRDLKLKEVEVILKDKGKASRNTVAPFQLYIYADSIGSRTKITADQPDIILDWDSTYTHRFFTSFDTASVFYQTRLEKNTDYWLVMEADGSSGLDCAYTDDKQYSTGLCKFKNQTTGAWEYIDDRSLMMRVKADTFTLFNPFMPPNYISCAIGATSFDIRWTKEPGTKTMVMISAAHSSGYEHVPISDHQTYGASNHFGIGDHISEWYCVYNDTGSLFTLYDLKPGMSYELTWYSYVGAPGHEMYSKPQHLSCKTFSRSCAAPAQPGAVSGANRVCSSSTNEQYSIARVAGANMYYWTYHSFNQVEAKHPIITESSEGDSVSINFNGHAAWGNLTVCASNNCGTSSSSGLGIWTVKNESFRSPIVGPTEVEPGAQNVSYNTTPNYFTNSFTWRYSGTGVSMVNNANTVKLNFASNFTPGVLSVRGQNADCGWYADSSVLNIVRKTTIEAGKPIRGQSDVCSSSNNLIYTSDTIANVDTYYWEYTGTDVTIAGTSNTVSLNFGPNATSGQLTVKGSKWNKFGESSPAFDITVKPLPGSLEATPQEAVKTCKGQTINCECPDIQNATEYIWTYGSCASTIAGNGSKNIALSFSPDAVSDTLTVHGKNECGTGAKYVYAIYSIPLKPDTADTIKGKSVVCPNEKKVIYHVAEIDNASSYIWTYSGTGATINGSLDSLIIDFQPNAINGNLTVRGANRCEEGALSQNFPIIIREKAGNATSISGQSPVCAGSTNLSYETEPIANVTAYEWKFSTKGVTFTDSTRTPRLNFSRKVVTGTLEVRGKNECSVGNSSELFSIDIKPLPGDTGRITGNDSICTSVNSESYSIAPLTNTQSYHWVFDGTGVGLIEDATKVTLNRTSAATNGLLMVYGINNCGIGDSISLPIKFIDVPTKPSDISCSDTVICDGRSNVLFRIKPTPEARSYKWNADNNGVAIDATDTIARLSFPKGVLNTNLRVYAINTCGTSEASNAYSVVLTPYPAVPVIDIQSTSLRGEKVCPGDKLSYLNLHKYLCRWFDATKDSSVTVDYYIITPASAGYIKLKVTNKICSTWSDTLQINVLNTTPPVILQKSSGTATMLYVNNNPNIYGSFLWMRVDGGEIPVSTPTINQYITLTDSTAEGIYQLQTIDHNGCILLSDTVLVQSLRKIKDGFNQIKVYPSIGSGLFTFEMINNERGPIVIEILNTSGMIVKVFNYSKLSNTAIGVVDIQGINTGHYLMRVGINSITESFKIIVQK